MNHTIIRVMMRMKIHPYAIPIMTMTYLRGDYVRLCACTRTNVKKVKMLYGLVSCTGDWKTLTSLTHTPLYPHHPLRHRRSLVLQSIS